jgi:N-acetylglucosaminyldiphosphoundecaprenol N-acetyl-beta-D-mannosaminyltransferase
MTSPVHLFGMRIDAVNLNQAVAEVFSWIEKADRRCRFVVTPNVDHAVMFQEDPRLRAAYRSASLVVADGHPVVLASRLLGCPLPQRVAGSDLVPALFARASTDRPLRVFLLGAAPGVAERAARNIEAKCPGVRVVGSYSPPLGFEKDAAENGRILGMIAAAAPDLLVVGLGAPKQELWVHQHRREIRASAAVCAGATIDFLAGEKRRAPRWLQRLGLEWLHRLVTEPRRLVRRYARDAWLFPQLVWNEWSALPAALGAPAAE